MQLNDGGGMARTALQPTRGNSNNATKYKRSAQDGCGPLDLILATEVIMDRSASEGDGFGVSHYADDRELMRLEIDVGARVRAYQCGWFCAHAFPFRGIACLPTHIYMLTCFNKYQQQVAAAHRLILREKTLLLEVDSYSQPWTTMEAGQGEFWPVPTCFCGGTPVLGDCCHAGWAGSACACGQMVPGRRQVIRLAELQSIEVEGAPTTYPCNCGGMVIKAPEHLVVTGSSNKPAGFDSIWGGIGMQVQADMMSIAGPKNADEFVAAVMAQRAKVVEQNIDSDPPPEQDKPKNLFQQAMGGWGAPQPMAMDQGAAPVVTPVAAAPVTSAVSLADEIAKLSQLKADGVLTAEQFENAKNNLIAHA